MLLAKSATPLLDPASVRPRLLLGLRPCRTRRGRPRPAASHSPRLPGALIKFIWQTLTTMLASWRGTRPGRAVDWAATSRAAMERSSRFRPPLRWLCSSTASERCFASADFLLTVQDGVYEHGGRVERALDAPRVNGGGAGGFGGAFFVCVTRVARHARGRCVGCQRACCWPCACAHSALR